MQAATWESNRASSSSCENLGKNYVSPQMKFRSLAKLTSLILKEASLRVADNFQLSPDK
jgi:hypothetical protein